MAFSSTDAVEVSLGLKAMTTDCKRSIEAITSDDFLEVELGQGAIADVIEKLSHMKTTCLAAVEKGESAEPFKDESEHEKIFEAFVNFLKNFGTLLERLAEKAFLGPKYLPLFAVINAIRELWVAIQRLGTRLGVLCRTFFVKFQVQMNELEDNIRLVNDSWTGR